MQRSVTRSECLFTSSTDPLLLVRSLQDDIKRNVAAARERNSGELRETSEALLVDINVEEEVPPLGELPKAIREIRAARELETKRREKQEEEEEAAAGQVREDENEEDY